MRFQAMMPDILHWLGVTKIDRFMSMSNMVSSILFFKCESQSRQELFR